MESEMVVPPPPKRRGRKRKIIDVQDVTVDCEGKKVLQTRSLKLIGRYVMKEFQGSGLFLGKIVSYASGLYRISYDDGDCEDLNSGELRSCLVEDGDLIGKWSERKEQLDNLLSKEVTPEVLKVENMVTECADQVDLSIPVESRNNETGNYEVQEVHTDAYSSSDSYENTRDQDSIIDMEVPLVPPPELPPSSGHIGVPEEYVSHLLSVYTFLRSFSVRLFLYPFGLDEFVGALNCSVANTLLDSVNVALMLVLKRHFERLSSEGSELALKCLRCLDWSLLDALTWPVYVVHYLLVMGYTNGPDWKGFHTHSLERDYYTLPAGRKLMVLQILCDDVLDSEELRAEMDAREESEVGIDVDRSAVFASTGVPRRVHPRYSKTSTCDDRQATKGITEHHEIQSFISHSMGSQVGEPVESSADKDGNGDECRLCGMDGFLLCCDGCPSSYHSRCLGLNKMHIAEGSWYCPECKINATEPKISRGTDLRGGNICGIDPYEQVFVATCDHLLVLKASIDSWTCLRYYSRHDIPKVLYAFYSKAEHVNLYSEICREIMHCWELPEIILPHYEVSETGLQLADGEISGECTGQSLNLLYKLVQDMTVIDNVGSCITDINSADMANSDDMKSVQKPVLCDNILYTPKYDKPETTDLTLFSVSTVRPANTCEFNQQSTSSMTETFTHTTNNNNGSAIGNSLIGMPCTRRKLDNCVGGNMYGRQHDGYLYTGSSFNSTDYINYYVHGDFAASAAASLAILSSEENQVPESRHLYNRRKGLSDSVSLQLKAFSMAAMRFFWPNTEKKLVEVPRERCSWCFSCKAPVSSRRGCLLNAAVSNSIKGAIKVLSGVRPMNNGDGRLPGIITYILFMEESLRGLLVGPFLNDAFRMRWRKQVERASTCNAIKIILLELEENIRQIALSEDWMRLFDGISSQPSTSQVPVSVTGSTQKRRPGRRGRKPSIVVDVAVDGCQDEPSDFTWWRGGSLSKLVLQRGFLPRSVIRKAARQGCSTKIPGIYYLEGQETPKRTRQLVWRSAVEMSRSAAQLAHQVRCLDFHVRWSDLVRPEQVAYDGKGPETEASAFRNAFVSDKKIVEHEIRYCVAFGNQKHLPSRVMKNIAEIEQMTNDGKERYWFSETRIPLYLIKEYEEKTEKDIPMDEFFKLQRKQLNAFHKNIFAYLSLKRDNMERDYCCSCNLDLLYRNAVQCNACQGFCHGQCASSSTVNVNEEVEFFITCKRCCETQVGTQVESSNGSPTSPLLLHGQDIRKAATTKKVGKLAGYKGSSASVRTVEHFSEVKSVNHSSVTKKSKIKNWGLIWGKKNCEVASSDFRLKNILFRGSPHLNLIQPSCRLCNQPCNSDLMYIRCETCKCWFHAESLELDESKIFSLIGFKCCKCRRIRSPVCPYMDTEKKKVLEDKIEQKQPSKQEISEMDSDSGVIAEHYKEDLLVYSTLPTKAEISPLTADDRLLFSLSEVEQLTEHKSEVEHRWNNASVSVPGPRKLPVRRHVRQENQVDYPCPGDPFQVKSNVAHSTEKLPFRRQITQENNLDCNSSTNSFQLEASEKLEANGMSYMQESSPPQVEWIVSNDSFDDGITLDYDSLGCDDMAFEPQTYFSFNELLASDDDVHTNGNESLENATQNWGRSSLPENGSLGISYDQEEPTLSVETLEHLVPCKICSHTEPYPDLSCQACGVWIHGHCSHWVESSSWENGWKCGHCRESR
ncbi:DDT domain-containing protein PTM-like [Primulina huaijiensis]|uniref:DDT domain-containing protein PTM-like n=1 Tax=Primulina huaijiensis TaxID=1492673 RepID=UPI003CC731A1